MKKFYCILTLWWLATTVNGQSFRNEWIDYNKTYYKFPVSETRLYRIPLSALTSIGLGNIPAQDFQLWRNGAEVPLFTTQETGPLAADGFIEFYGKMNDGYPDTELYASPNDQVNTDRSYFSDTAWFYLTVNAGKPNLRLKQAANNVAGTSVAPETYFTHFYKFQSYWTWNYGAAQVVAGQAVRSSLLNGGEGWAAQPFNNWAPLNFNLTGLYVSDKGPAQLDFAYSVSGNYPLDRNIQVYINDSLVGSVFSAGYSMKKDTVRNLSTSVVRGDALSLKFMSDNPFYWENIYLNNCGIRYPRKFSFGGESSFEMTLPAKANGHHLRMQGFRSDNQPMVVYDLTNNKRYQTNVLGDSNYVLLDGTAASRNVVVNNQVSFVRNITGFTQKRFINYAQAANQGDYIIISHKIISGSGNAIDQYKAYRSSPEGGSYKVLTTDIDELAEQFGYGQRKHPLAIRNFVRYALNSFSTKPKFVFLIGHATYYEIFRGLQGIPGAQELAQVPNFGTPASDNLLVSADNNSPVPQIPVGRLSAITNEEVLTYLDKVKQYEALLRNPTASAAERDWKKEMIHLVGGDDVFLANIITNFFNRYRLSVADTSIAAKVYTYKRVNNPSFASDMAQIKNRIDNGAGLITYFGHSSASGIDFNLSGPEEYKNTNGKYPIFIANGCRAGNIFDFSSYRLNSKNVSVSENFIFAKNKGAITFISNSDLGVINYMHLFTNEFYKQFSRFNYGKTIGEIQRESIQQAWNITGGSDPLNRINLEQVILHSDPAIVPYPYPSPDYTTSEDLISFLPASPNVANDSIWVKVKFANIGRAVRETVPVVLYHEKANGQKVELLRTTITNLLKMDSVQVKMGLQGMFDGGTNYLIASIDPDGSNTEFSEQNNTARKAFDLNTNVILPVFPYDLGIIQGPVVKLSGSTANPVAKLATYRFQVDTSKNFNSPLLFTKDTISIGGALSIVPNIAWKTNTVYYWRVSPVSIGVATNWAGASFLYNPTLGSGSNQSHYYQHLQSSLAKMMLGDASNRQFAFQDIPQNLYAEHGIYPTSGTEEGHFSIIVNGLRSIRSACIGSSIIFNVFDGQTFKPWDNSVGGQYGSGYYCGPGREYNFEFYYYSQANRKTIMDFLNIIPKGHYVAARMVLDPPHDSSFAKYWLNDTAMYGKGNSLYHALVKQGFQNIDSLNKPRTFAFFFKKDDTLSFKPVTVFSEGLYDRIQTSQNLYTKDTSGNILSPDYGPATAWKTLTWASLKDADPASKGVANLQLYGKTKTGTYTLLRNLSSAETNVDISSISATTYPYVQLRMHTGDTAKAKPVQLQHWRVTYDPVADGALSAADYWRWTADTLLQLKDSLRLGIAFKNVSAFPMAATNYTLKLGNKNGQEINLQNGSLKSLNAGDTARIYFAGNIDSLLGRYYLRLEVNGAKAPVEQAYFNNLAYMPFDVDSLKDAVQLISFNATPGTNQVNTSWNVALELKVGKYEILHGTDSSVAGMQVVLTQQPVNAAAPQQQYLLAHTNPVIGNNYYRLRITDIYGNVILSKAIEIKVRLLDYTMLPSGNALLHNWKFENEMKLTNYRIEHAVNTGSFAAVATRVATNTGVPETNYTYSHTKPSLGINKYRLAYTDAYGNNYANAEKSITIALQQFNVVVNGKVVDMQWDFTNEINIADYVVESGVDSSKLSSIYTQLPSGNGAGTFTYNYQHGNPPLGYNFYRLRVKDGNGNIVYSPVYKVFVGDATTVIVYPNPFVNEIRIVTGDNSSSWHAELIDAAGRILVNQTGVGSMSIPTGTLLPGVYFIRYQKGDFKLMQKLQKH
ncbi:C25 family cysteine peptidase [Phnomibacter ginsenosidimutans]|uniref:T9SS type A sorting domain-containing protein n=1 Tax=Phnomibacter ginsenosidimutans TaxID=2676868 RepID=A0A6I6G6R2_9BACT|nr:C25 family cysteine peptidase [Phnomibacter ginsenosidimutans]QGW28396.1 T9SS type A sorting domain-containing protein [Phnomibacter ginsenosidimutans]